MVFFQLYFHSEQYFFPYNRQFSMLFSCIKIQTFQTDWVDSSTQYSLVIQNSCSTDYPVLFHPSFTSVMSHFLSLIIIYFIVGVKSWSPTLLVAISVNCRLPSYQSILCVLHFSPFLTKCIILAMCLMCLVSLPFLAINRADLLSNIIRGASSCSKIHQLTSWNLLKPFLQCMMNCTRFPHFIEQMFL